MCGPERGISTGIGLLLLVPVLVWLMPVTAAAIGLAFGLFDATFDPEWAARHLFAGFAGLCAVVIALVIDRRRRQASLIASRARTADVVAIPTTSTRLPRTSLVLVCVFAALAIGSLATYHERVTTESAHLRVAERQSAQVTDVDSGNSDIVLRLPSGITHRVEVADTGPYPLNSYEPVLVDQADGAWIRLVAEPADFTYWLAGASSSIALALIVLARMVAAVRGRRRLLSWPQFAMDARVRPVGNGRLEIFASDDTHGTLAIGSLIVDAPPEPWLDQEQSDSTDPWSLFAPRRPSLVTVAGAFVDGGWVSIVTRSGAVLPITRLEMTSARRRRQLAKANAQFPAVGSAPRDSDRTSDREVFVSDPTTRVPELPLVITRGKGPSVAVYTQIVGAYIVAAAVAYVVPLSFSRLSLLIVCLCAAAVLNGIAQLRSVMTLSHEGLLLNDGWRRTTIGWVDVAAVSRVGSSIFLALTGGAVMPLGGFPSTDAGDRAGDVGRAITTLRDRASAFGATRRISRVTDTFGPTVIGAYVVLVALSGWLGATTR